MPQKKARISDALKNEYADFANFCVSLDKQFISELTTSDFIAFRTQYSVTRDYISSIRCVLDNYDPEIDMQQQESQTESHVEKSAVSVIPDKEMHFTGKLSEKPKQEELAEVVSAEQDLDIKKIFLTEELTDESINATSSFDDSPLPTAETSSQDLGKSYINISKELKSLPVDMPIYKAFSIFYDCSYTDRSIIELKLSNRSYNRLKGNHVDTLHNLFSTTIGEISRYSNMGKVSLLEIIEKCKEFAITSRDISTSIELNQLDSIIDSAKASKKVLSIAKAIALGIEYNDSELDDIEKKYVILLEEGYQLLGEDLCRMILEKPHIITNLYYALSKYVKQQELHDQFNQIVERVSNHGISKNSFVLPFVIAVKRKTPIDLTKIFSENTRFVDLPKMLEKYLEENPAEEKSLLYSICEFADVICIGISEQIKKAYECAINTDRDSVVLQYRKEGYSLAEIGDLLNISRQRVRQIESRAVNRFSVILGHSAINVIEYIHAMLDGDLMIHKNEIAPFVMDEKHLDLLWKNVENGFFDCDGFRYEKQYEAIVFNHKNAYIAEKIVESLPPYIFKDELEEIIQRAVKEEDVWEEKIRADIKQRYKVFGKLYSIRRPTVLFICDWILKNRFINGFKINDEIDAKRFYEYVSEVFGEDYSHISSRALDAKISSVGLLCDRGKYIHPSLVTIDTSILNEVDKYIADSPKNAITYVELFKVFKDKLAGSQISNHYFLQGVMKQFKSNDCKKGEYYFHRDYITKDANVSPTDELESFLRERGMAYKTEIFAEFPALNEYVLSQVVARCENVFSINGGYYIHSSQFHIQETDYAPLKAYLTEATHEMPVNIRKVYDDCSIQFFEFMERNEIQNRDVLYAVLSYMFRNDFKFNKPYIANSDDIEMTNRGVILSILEPYDEIAIDELMDLLDERSIHYVSLSHLMELTAPDYIRSDENTLMKRSLTGVDDVVVEEALNILNDAIEANGYLPSCKVLDFIWYPSIDVAWTPYLLESIVLSSNRLDYVPYSFSRSHRSLIVYVSKKYVNCDFQTMILKIISEEYDKGTFTSKSDMREWLIETGLVDSKLPHFLEGAQYYYMDDDGRLIRREET